MIGTCAALLTTQLVNVVPGDSPSAKLAYASAIVGGAAYLLGLMAVSGFRNRHERSCLSRG
jgi:hypothetical protein